VKEMVGNRTDAIGIVLPVHNEEQHIGAALSALGVAMSHPGVATHHCRLVIVLDSCNDSTAQVVRRWSRTHSRNSCTVIECRSANVGTARQLGCMALLTDWDGLDPERIWIATTDADSEVPSDWLSVQSARHDAGYDFWAGRVAIRDWSSRSVEAARAWTTRYVGERAPIHGANLGFNAGAYLEAGGFQPLPTGEDRALHAAIRNRSRAVYHDHRALVVTSARRDARAPKGFADRLDSIEISGQASA